MALLDIGRLPGDPLEALRELARGEAELGRLRREAIEAARAAGATWEQVGAALGMSRQAAWEYYARATKALLERTTVDAAELSEDEAMKIAVAETKAARRARRRS